MKDDARFADMLGEMAGRATEARKQRYLADAERYLPRITKLCKRAASHRKTILFITDESDRDCIGLPKKYQNHEFYNLIARKLGIRCVHSSEGCYLKWEKKEGSIKYPIDPDF